MLRRIVCEPLVHFMLLGALIWGLNQYLQPHGTPPRITISTARTAQIAEHYRQQYGSTPSAQQLDSLVDAAITEESFYRAAIELGLDKDDEIVRRRLVQKYEFVQQDLSDLKEPSEAELHSFYVQHQERYRLAARITFTHVYFSPDHLGDDGARHAAELLASTLNRRGATQAADQGDQFPGPRNIAALSEQEVAHVFGRDGLSQDVFTTKPAKWSAPLRSGFGWHSVYVTSLVPGRQAEFDAVHERVKEDFLEAERSRRSAEATAALRRRFEIVRE